MSIFAVTPESKHHSQRTAQRDSLTALALPAFTLAVLSLAVALLLVFSPLYGLPDTSCQNVVTQPAGGGCSAQISHRWHLIAMAVAVAAVLALAGFLARGRRSRPTVSPARRVALGLAAASVMLGLGAAASLSIGMDNNDCGSVLSKLDQYGSYSLDRPAMCAPSYQQAWRTAWTTGALGVAALVASTMLEIVVVRRRQDQ